MRMNVGALSALSVAIAMAMAAPAAGAEATPAPQAQNAVQPAQEQAGAADKATTQKTPAADPRGQVQVSTLGPVIVSATRRTETLQEVPMAISAVTYHDIQRKHLQSFSDYAADVPGLNVVTSGAGLAGLSLRGIASGSGQPSASVGIYIDDAPFGSSSVFAGGALLTPDLDPADLERIEVLRGPQGTLYGAGALGGVVRFITIQPDTESYSGRLQLGGTSVSGGGNGFGMRGMVNLPLVANKLAIRANVYDRTDPGFIDDAGLGKTDVNESRVKGGRASLLWTPTDKTSLRMTALAQNLNSDGNATEALDPATLAPVVYGDLQQRIAGGTGTFSARYRLYNATFNTDFGWATLMASSSYSTLDAVQGIDATSAMYFGPQANGRPYGTLQRSTVTQSKATQEVRLTSPKSQSVEWLLGVFTTHETGNPVQYVYPSDYYTGTELPSPLGVSLYDDSQPSTYDEYAVYGSVTWHLSDRFDVGAGLRYSRDRQHFTDIGSGLLVGTTEPTVLIDKRSADSTTTFSLTPTFHINDNAMLYARVASGFLPGGPNVVPATVQIPGVPASFSPTELTSYELGLKSISLNDRLTVDLSAYYIDWTKIPLITLVGPYAFLGNGGQADSKGLEATIAFIPTRGLKLSVNASYNDAALTKDAPAPSNGKRGDQLPYAPKFTVGLNGDYDFVLGAGWHGYVGASYRYIDKRSADFAFGTNQPSPTVPGYNTVDLRIGASHDQWSIAAYVKNLTNQRGIVRGGTISAGTTVPGQLNPITGKMENNVTIITPRLVGISVSRDF